MELTERHPVLRPLFHGHIWLALGAVAQRWWIGQHGIPTDAKGLLAVFFAVIGGYGYLRLVRALEPAPISSPHIQWVRKNQRLLTVVVGLSVLLALAFVWEQFLVFGNWSLLVPLLVGLYMVPIRNAEGRSLGLREVPGLKTVLIALGWTFITCGLGAGDLRVGQNGPAVWLATMQFFFFMALAMAFDIGDVRFDRAGLRTFPQLLGAKGAKVIALIFLLPWITFKCIWLVISYAPIGPGWREPSIDLPALLSLLGLFGVASCIVLATPDRPRWYFSVVLDGLLILVPMLSCIGSAIQ